MHRVRAFGTFVLVILILSPVLQLQSVPKLDAVLQERATYPTGRSFVIVQPLNATVDLLVQSLGGTLGRPLALVDGRAADVPNTALSSLAASAAVTHVAFDRATSGMMERTAATVGALAVRNDFGYNGSGIGVAVIDSGIAPHDD